jgi:ATP-dependent Clp protease ATP-binding subunit ClpA
LLKAFFGRPMRGYNFTERVRRALARAREEAARLRHEYVGTEHILLGLLRDDGCIAAAVIESFGVKLDALAAKVDEVVKKGRPGQTTGPDLPYTSRAKKVLELAMEEARDANHDYVGTEHLLLGVLREERGIAAQLLVDAGVTLDAARERVLHILGRGPAEERLARHGSGGLRSWAGDWRMSGVGTSASGSMAASIIELLAQDTGVSAVFAAQGIDVAKLVAALRAISGPSAQDSPPAT